VSGVPNLDKLGELYPGFSRDRETLKQSVRGYHVVWMRAFKKLRGTDEYYQRSAEDVARVTMRMLMDAIKS
jgi:hypothetical protein